MFFFFVIGARCRQNFHFPLGLKGLGVYVVGGGGVKGIFVTRELRYLLGENSGGCFLSGET